MWDCLREPAGGRRRKENVKGYMILKYIMTKYVDDIMKYTKFFLNSRG
jgi:hypothetical protein